MEVTLKRSDNKILYIFIAASLLLHLSFSVVYISENASSIFSPDREPEEKTIVIKLQPQKSKNAKQVAQTQQSKNNEIKKPRFLSNKNNTFDRETKSANNGKFQAAGQGRREALARRNIQISKKAKTEKLKKLKFSDLAFETSKEVVIKKKKKIARLNETKKGLKNGRKTGVGLGQTNDFLDDIPLGDFTRLNSQEYEFYGFYHRIREKLEQFWGQNIQDKADKISKQGRSIASDSNLITGLTIMLNDSGEIVKIHLKSTSGVKELDDAAVQSFNQAGPFPNPPKGMLKQGTAIIEWGFVVNT